MASIADELDLDAGSTLTKQGARGQEFVVIAEGAADVVRNGKKVNTLGSGDFLGEIALITAQPRTATVKTTAPTRILVISASRFPPTPAQDAVDPGEGACGARRASAARGRLTRSE